MPNVIETTDAAATTATSYNLAVGQTGQGAISGFGDHDYWRVSLVAGQTYTFALIGTGGTQLGDPFFQLRGSSGVLIGSNDDGGPGVNPTLTFTATTTGTYFLDAGGYGDNYTGQYGISVTAGSHAHYDETMGAGNLTREGTSWAAAPATAVNVSYSIDTSNPDQQDAQNNPTPFIALTAAQAAAAQACLAQFSEAGNITFTQAAANTGTIRFSAYNSTTDGAGAYAYYPGSTGANDVAGDVNLNNDSVSTSSLPQGSYSFYTMLHEIGHAVGLSHPGDYNAAPGVDIEYDTHAQFTEDSHQYTVMSYFDESNTTDDYESYPDTLMMFDILAVQQLYGVNHATRAGNSIYGFGSNVGATYNFATNTNPAFCIWDGAGIDTLNASGFSQSQRLDLRAGYFSDIGGVAGNVSIAIGAVIETAVGGSGNDFLIGNSANNTLNGGAGADNMQGGAGNDTYFVNHAGDVVIDLNGQGTDTISSSVTFSLNGSWVENLTLTGAANLNATGNGLANTLTGNSGNNTLDGQVGADTMKGGAGNDSYVVNHAGDVVIDVNGQGTDTIRSSVSFGLNGSWVENLTLTGAANVNATGNGLANILTGNTGANTLAGQGGADIMRGGAGNDLYGVADAGDIVDESVAGSNGIDTVNGSISISLSNAVHFKGAIENATLIGSANLYAYGNALANVLTGNAGANTLVGYAGADIMRGGAGNDLYGVDNAGDIVDESIAGSGGIDAVNASISININDAARFKGSIENASIIGSANLSLTGNMLGNVLNGNAGANVITGWYGNDTLTGGAGNDIFQFNSALNAATNRDTITDMNQNGNDTIRLENAIFTTLAAGALAATAFHIGAVAAEADDRIVYNSANGQLSYDINGNAGGGATLFAILDPGLALTAADFFVV